MVVRLLFCSFLLSLTLTACKKKIVRQSYTTLDLRIDNYNKIKGDYRVFDSTGNYLYELSIKHIFSQYSEYGFHDTLAFEGFDGQFNFKRFQGSFSAYSDFVIHIGYQVEQVDSLNNRWKIIGHFDPTGVYDNEFHDDTIRFIYRKININYYIQDLTPYHDTIIKIVAVKK